MTAQQKMMGYEIPGDEKVPVPVRDWNAQKLALWKSRELATIAAREAELILNLCRHERRCPGIMNETESCVAECPDRETRMSALVILNAARQLAPADARKPAEPYYAPSREYFSEVMAALAAAQVENEVLREVMRQAGIAVPAGVAPTPQLEEVTS